MRKPNKRQLILAIIGGGGVVVAGGIWLVYNLWQIKTKLYLLKNELEQARVVVQSKDLGKMHLWVKTIETDLVSVKKNWQRLSWLRWLPKIGVYYSDGKDGLEAGIALAKAGATLLQAISPYQDFLGLKAEATPSGATTTEGRIEFLIESVDGVLPYLDQLEKQVVTARDKLANINPQKYPPKFRGYPIRKLLVRGQRLVGYLANLVENGRPLLEKASWILGKDEPRYYLALFQNNGELRPTGGFWTAYGILKVENGKVTPLISEDIYALDSRFTNKIPAPRPIKKYHKNVYYWYLRDMNLSPDFRVSVEKFLSYYQKIARIKPDGVVAVDTNLLVDLLKVLGEVGVPEWGNFNAKPDPRCWGCPQVVYRLEVLADKPLPTTRAQRKGFLAPLMHSLLSNILGSPKDRLPALAGVFWTNLRQKHLLVYFPSQDLQKAVEALNFAGRIQEVGPNQDYFALIDCNFAGAKSNLFIEQSIKQEYQINRKGEITKTVIVTYKNPAPPSDCNLQRGGLCLNGLYRNWFRFYLPAGSTLVKLTGSEVDPVVYQELGKTVVEGFFGDQYPLRPRGSARVKIVYRLPFATRGHSLTLVLQKQPGTKNYPVEIWVNGQKQHQFLLDQDRTMIVSW